MARYISDKDVHLLAEDLLFDNAIFYLNDFEMPRITKTGTVAFETYNAPDFEIAAEGERIILRTRLEGYAKEELSATIEDNVLTVAGKRKAATASGEDAVRDYGTFYREIYIPRSIDQKKITVTYHDDELVILMPKRKIEKLRVLDIQ